MTLQKSRATLEFMAPTSQNEMAPRQSFTLKEECAAFRRDAIMRRLYAHGGHRLNTANSLGVTLKTLSVDLAALRNAGYHDPAGFLVPPCNGVRR